MEKMNYPLYFGGYYRFLGWFSLATILISLVAYHWTQSIHLDPSFLIWFWLGKELKNEKSSARKWATGIGIFVFCILVAGALLEGGHATFFGVKYPSGTFGYYAVAGIIGVLLVVPGFVLATPQAKRQFTK